MKLSLNWIKKYVDLPEELSKEKLAHDLTMCTVEVEEVISIAEKFENIVVGRILTVEPHPNADKLRVCKVDIGENEPSIIVCGGSNLKQNQLTVVATPGAKVAWHGMNDIVEIKPTKLRGVESNGMICSSSEIGLEELFPITQPAEIMDISDFDVKPGTSVADALDINDIIFDIDNKSLTNRPDLWGHYGMAREFAAIYNCELKPFKKVDLPDKSDGLEICIESEARCPRYAALIIKNIKNIPSSFEIQSLLWRVGVRPINLPVDITNYAMMVTGQPTHAFDRTHVTGNINIRLASPDEKLELLDGEVLELTTEDLVIADDKGPIALAGVMGGELSSVLSDTTELIIEIANFNALSVRRTAKRFDKRTEASSRYEKAIDPQRVDDAVAITAELFKSEFPESQIIGFVDRYPSSLENSKIEVSLNFLYKRLGKELPEDDIKKYLMSLGFKVSFAGDSMYVEAPSWRSTGDISLPDDILEEVARMIGYENFDFIPPTVLLDKAINQRSIAMERSIREYMAFRCNMQEIFTYPWVDEEYIVASGIDGTDMLELSAPPAPNERHLRSSLIPGLLKSVFINLRYYESFRIFELTQTFRNNKDSSKDTTSEVLPDMPRHLAAAFVGSDGRTLFREAKGVIEYMHKVVQIEELSFAHLKKPVWSDEKLWVNIVSNDEIIGDIGLVCQKVAHDSGIKRSLTVIFDLDIETLKSLASRDNVFVHLPEFPLVNFDLSIIFDETVEWLEIHKIVSKTELVKDISFVDEYRSSQIGDGKKSVTFRTWIGSDEGTLTSDKIELITKQITKNLNNKLGGEIRR
ncbi:MAG: phenylalanine--tRNA ligase subunit beta [Synergistaceae bacterium]|nr:phenylalanine--tRNA ligase subunit beta [Synergistaceae bacterium]